MSSRLEYQSRISTLFAVSADIARTAPSGGQTVSVAFIIGRVGTWSAADERQVSAGMQRSWLAVYLML